MISGEFSFFVKVLSHFLTLRFELEATAALTYIHFLTLLGYKQDALNTAIHHVILTCPAKKKNVNT